jgi:tetratricopeptide (TPR) repeat protein
MRYEFSSKPAGARWIFLICLGLAVATVAVYWRVGGYGFQHYDDVDIFFKNIFVRQGLTWNSIIWGANTCYYEYWHPLMWWSHMLDCQLFGLNAGAHHLVNLGFHVANTLMVFLIFRQMTGMVWRSAVVAALFGLHPLHVESVAWLAERKDLLSTFFWLLSVWAYVRYVQESKGVGARLPGPRAKTYYWLALVMFLLGLLSKPMVVTLPFVLLLLDYWPLHRIGEFGARSADLKTTKKAETLRVLVWEKWPFFGLTAVFCFITWYSVKLGKTFPTLMVAPPSVRLVNIPVAYVLYIWKTIYPHNLAVLYPMPDHVPWWQVAGATLILAGISWAAVRARRAKYLFFGWFVFLGILVPTIGIVQVGGQAMADRYMYVPLIGLFAAAVWGVADMSRHWSHRTIILSGVTVLALAVCAALSCIQVQYWRDDISLWRHCLDAGYESMIAHHDLGRDLIDAGNADKGLEEYEAALKLDPEGTYGNLGVGAAMIAANRPREATNYIAKALRVDPGDAVAHGDMGVALINLKDYEGAIAQISQEIQMDPSIPSARANLGQAYSAEGKSDLAIGCFMTAVKLDPTYAAGYYYLGKEYLKQGAIDEATSNLEKAAELDPQALEIHLQLADVYTRRHENAKAAAKYHEIVRLNPNVPEALNNYAWLLATSPDLGVRNGAEAVKLAESACKQTSWQKTLFIGTLAAAYAEAGDFEKAVQTAQKACDSASAHGEKELLQANQNLMAQYKDRHAVHEQNTN